MSCEYFGIQSYLVVVGNEMTKNCHERTIMYKLCRLVMVNATKSLRIFTSGVRIPADANYRDTKNVSANLLGILAMT